MRILSLETTAITGGVALLEGEQLIAELILREDQRSAQSLAPAIQAAAQSAGWSLDTIQLIAIAVGPGSFTGLRVGITTAKILAFALGAEVLGLDTLRVLAAQAAEQFPGMNLHAALDAQRNEVFAATFAATATNHEATCTQATHILSQADWLASLPAGEVVVGPVLRKLATQLPAGVVMADESRWNPQARTIGQLAYRDYLAGRREDLYQLAPQYHRLSYAEEKRRD
jgi:tRNA threonylcarbamoyladenosine biosynthesis protein TsaB